MRQRGGAAYETVSAQDKQERGSLIFQHGACAGLGASGCADRIRGFRKEADEG